MLSPNAQKMIHDYFNLPFKGVTGVRTPYFNNLRWRQRGQLKALSGKGAPEEIVEETKIISIQYHFGLFDHAGNYCLGQEKNDCDEAEKKIRHTMVDNGLGVDCSGFVTNILNAHYKETAGVNNLARKFYKGRVNPLRRLINYLRPVENTGVVTYADDKNTQKIEKITEAKPGDVIIMLNIPRPIKHNHILLITENKNNKITYLHARAWASEGKYGHGVGQGEIIITHPNEGLLQQQWTEQEKTNEKNETYLEARQTVRLEIRRIRV